MRDGEVALPGGVGRVERGEALEDGEGFTERGQRLVQPAFGLQDFTEKELRAAKPRRIGCSACESDDSAGFGLELGGFSTRMLYHQRSEQRLYLGRCGEPTAGSSFPEGKGERMANLGASAIGEFPVQRRASGSGAGLVSGKEVVECLNAGVGLRALADVGTGAGRECLPARGVGRAQMLAQGQAGGF